MSYDRQLTTLAKKYVEKKYQLARSRDNGVADFMAGVVAQRRLGEENLERLRKRIAQLQQDLDEATK